jgi:hypothetical protein
MPRSVALLSASGGPIFVRLQVKHAGRAALATRAFQLTFVNMAGAASALRLGQQATALHPNQDSSRGRQTTQVPRPASLFAGIANDRGTAARNKEKSRRRPAPFPRRSAQL